MAEDRLTVEDAVYFYELLPTLPDDAKTIVDLMFIEATLVGPRNLRQLVLRSAAPRLDQGQDRPSLCCDRPVLQQA